MINLHPPYLKGNELKYVSDCIKTEWITEGKYIKLFEESVSKYIGVKKSVSCINGTAGLHLALRILGVQQGDEVIVPALTFIAPVNAIKYLYADPVFMDCDDFLNIDVNKIYDFCKKECKKTKNGLVNKKTNKVIRAIIPVHIFGNPCDMESIMDISKEFDLKVVEDATESLGSKYVKGRYKGEYTGTISDIGVFSFNGNKIITSAGGGMLVSDNEKLIDKARYLINQAKDDNTKYYHSEIGYNYRTSNIHSAVGLAQMERLSEFIKRKKINYGLYKNAISKIDGFKMMDIPEGTEPNYWLFSLVRDSKKSKYTNDELIKIFADNEVQVRPIWRLNHLQNPYKGNRSYKIEKALWYSERVLNIPSGVQLKEKQINKVIDVLRKCHTT
jgi:perosamine synthetase